MSRSSSLCLSIISVTLTILVPITGYYINKLNTLEKNFTILVTTLNLQSPSLHLTAFISLATKKNVSPEKAAIAIALFEKNPNQGKLYLQNELHFDINETNAVLNSTKIQNNMSSHN